MGPLEAQLWPPLFSVSAVYLFLDRGVNDGSVLGRKKNFKTSGLVRLRWHGFYHTVLWYSVTSSRVLSNSSLLVIVRVLGEECGLIPRQLIALTGKIAVCTFPINIVNRV